MPGGSSAENSSDRLGIDDITARINRRRGIGDQRRKITTTEAEQRRKAAALKRQQDRKDRQAIKGTIKGTITETPQEAEQRRKAAALKRQQDRKDRQAREEASRANNQEILHRKANDSVYKSVREREERRVQNECNLTIETLRHTLQIIENELQNNENHDTQMLEEMAAEYAILERSIQKATDISKSV